MVLSSCKTVDYSIDHQPLPEVCPDLDWNPVKPKDVGVGVLYTYEEGDSLWYNIVMLRNCYRKAQAAIRTYNETLGKK